MAINTVSFHACDVCQKPILSDGRTERSKVRVD